ncbi:flagellar biosynthesis protein [Undibacterium pigrum]|uniref:Flagellar biosynthesis protein n=1 Tax=Undibacterium pigrum TaxID=401470 RepID=A0A318IY45_9BURK|nr:flagellar biosynthesis protein [Undibacterium pigrum]PXX40235.1 hypothetical protein DFR42_10868 [Undibacterium pigrum]
MLNTKYLAIPLLLVSAILTGCATSRSEVKLSTTTATTQSAEAISASNGRTVYIRSVRDERVFEEAPKEPSTPSLGYEGGKGSPELIKAKAIARKRNTFGKAMGDVLLGEGQTVTSVVKSDLRNALVKAGYRVEEIDASRPDMLVLDVHIKQFWAWFQPGFWAIKLNANIETVIDVSGFSSTTVSVHTEDSRQVATDSAWIEAVDKGRKAYEAEATLKLKSLQK